MDPVLEYNGVYIFPFDLDTLDSEGLLNNAILDFYLKYLYHVILSKEQRQKIDIFGSLFHQNIIQEGEYLESQEINILEKDFIMLPVNIKHHWFLIILCYPRNLIFRDSDLSDQPRMIILDSSIGFLKSHRSTFLKQISSFMAEQILQESGRCIDMNDLQIDIVPTAQQTNDYDCGLFLLEFAEKFVLDNFQPSARSFFSNNDTCKKRQSIKELIKELSSNRSSA